MGWDYSNHQGRTTLEVLREDGYFAGNVTRNSAGCTFTKKAVVGGPGGAYALTEYQGPGDEAPFRFITVILVQRTTREVGRKYLSEFAGPVEVRVPASILAKASSLDDAPASLFQVSPDKLESQLTHAREWRANVAKHQAFQKMLKGLKQGDEIVFAEPLLFSKGSIEVTHCKLNAFNRGALLIAMPKDRSPFLCRVALDYLSRRKFTVFPQTGGSIDHA